MRNEKYFADGQKKLASIFRVFLSLFFAFSLIFFMWSVMKTNSLEEEKANKQAQIVKLLEENEELAYLVDMPLDDAFKIRIAREKLGMCFPDEIIYYTDIKQ